MAASKTGRCRVSPGSLPALRFQRQCAGMTSLHKRSVVYAPGARGIGDVTWTGSTLTLLALYGRGNADKPEPGGSP